VQRKRRQARLGLKMTTEEQKLHWLSTYRGRKDQRAKIFNTLIAGTGWSKGEIVWQSQSFFRRLFSWEKFRRAAHATDSGRRHLWLPRLTVIRQPTRPLPSRQSSAPAALRTSRLPSGQAKTNAIATGKQPHRPAQSARRHRSPAAASRPAMCRPPLTATGTHSLVVALVG
jgi:hypothetical protein